MASNSNGDGDDPRVRRYTCPWQMRPFEEVQDVEERWAMLDQAGLLLPSEDLPPTDASADCADIDAALETATTQCSDPFPQHELAAQALQWQPGSGTQMDVAPVPAQVTAATSTAASSATLGEQVGEQETEKKTKNAWGDETYSDLISKAITSSPGQRSKLNKIYAWFERFHEHFRNATEERKKGWKNSIRHNLSHRKCFRLLEGYRKGLPGTWVFDPEADQTRPRRRATIDADGQQAARAAASKAKDNLGGGVKKSSSKQPLQRTGSLRGSGRTQKGLLLSVVSEQGTGALPFLPSFSSLVSGATERVVPKLPSASATSFAIVEGAPSTVVARVVTEPYTAADAEATGQLAGLLRQTLGLREAPPGYPQQQQQQFQHQQQLQWQGQGSPSDGLVGEWQHSSSTARQNPPRVPPKPKPLSLLSQRTPGEPLSSILFELAAEQQTPPSFRCESGTAPSPGGPVRRAQQKRAASPASRPTPSWTPISSLQGGWRRHSLAGVPEAPSASFLTSSPSTLAGQAASHLPSVTHALLQARSRHTVALPSDCSSMTLQPLRQAPLSQAASLQQLPRVKPPHSPASLSPGSAHSPVPWTPSPGRSTPASPASPGLQRFSSAFPSSPSHVPAEPRPFLPCSPASAPRAASPTLQQQKHQQQHLQQHQTQLQQQPAGWRQSVQDWSASAITPYAMKHCIPQRVQQQQPGMTTPHWQQQQQPGVTTPHWQQQQQQQQHHQQQVHAQLPPAASLTSWNLGDQVDPCAQQQQPPRLPARRLSDADLVLPSRIDGSLSVDMDFVLDVIRQSGDSLDYDDDLDNMPFVSRTVVV